MPPYLSPSRAAFTLVEMLAVITIAGVLAAAVIPTMDRVRGARRAAAADEVARTLVFARERAVASGRPVGVLVDPSRGALELVTIADDGGVEALASPLGERTPAVLLGDRFDAEFGRVVLTAAVAGPAPGTPSCVWFDHRGTPHARTASGEPAGLLSDATIEIVGAGEVRVAGWSGLVEAP
jgi:prepilin-type N-terminal cleavage/methylation domain-containing protein